MAAIVRDALIQDFEEVAAIAVEAYREYSHALTPDNWHTMQTNLSNVAAIAKQDRAEVIALHTSELMINARRMYERLGFQQDIELPRRLGIRYWRYVLKLQERSPVK
jgi:hypothetical protein